MRHDPIERALDLMRQGDTDAAAAVLDGDLGYYSRHDDDIVPPFEPRDREIAYELAAEASRLIADGLTADAARRLALWAEPKWSSLAACERSYRAAMEERS